MWQTFDPVIDELPTRPWTVFIFRMSTLHKEFVHGLFGVSWFPWKRFIPNHHCSSQEVHLFSLQRTRVPVASDTVHHDISWWDMGDNEGNLLGGIGRENVYVCVVRHGWYQSKASMGLERGHLPSGPCRPGGGGVPTEPRYPKNGQDKWIGISRQ